MHDVFISYKSEDSAMAIRVRDTLEANGIPCWIAERDISAGSNYAADIPNAIAQCRVLVLIFTPNSQESPWIMKELDSAIAGRKLILPLKFGYFEVSKTMQFLLTGVQYYDANADLDTVMKAVVHRIRQAVANNEQGKHKQNKTIKVRQSSGCLPALLVVILMWVALHRIGILHQIPHYPEIFALLSEMYFFLRDTLLELIAEWRAS